MTNVEKYQEIHKELMANPKLKVATLCKKRNASYSGFRYWLARLPHEAVEANRQPARASGNSHSPIAIEIPMSRLAAAVAAKETMVQISVNSILKNLSPAQSQAVLLSINNGGRGPDEDGGHT